jgi:FAD/FMN-containing dehydrogenase
MRYLNFAESPMDVATIYPRESYERLCALKRRYDPDHLFLANHPIRAAAEDAAA